IGDVIGDRLGRLLERDAERFELAFDKSGHGVLQTVFGGQIQAASLADRKRPCKPRERRSRLRPARGVPIFAAIRDRKEAREESASGGAVPPPCERVLSPWIMRSRSGAPPLP